MQDGINAQKEMLDEQRSTIDEQKNEIAELKAIVEAMKKGGFVGAILRCALD
jgi:prefoldin subunit 5